MSPSTGHHEHAHGLTATGRLRGRLALVAGLTLATFVAEVVGALLSGSLALLTDAGHLLTDSAGLFIALFAAALAARPPTTRHTYGWQRAEVLAALANGVALIGIAVAVALQSIQRWGQPSEVEPRIMLWVAIGGLMINVVGLLVLHGGRHESLNVRGAYLEVLGDSITSLAVIGAAVVIGFTGWWWVDSMAALLMFVLILPRAWALVRQAAEVLLEAAPRGIDVSEVDRHLRDLPGVLDVHDLHIWTITSGQETMSAHVVVEDRVLARGGDCALLDQLAGCLDEHFNVEHSTFQLESPGHREQGMCIH